MKNIFSIIRLFINYSIIIVIFVFTNCEKDYEQDLLVPSIQLISARQVSLTYFEIITSATFNRNISRAELIFDDITVLTDSSRFFDLDLATGIADTSLFNLNRLNHDFSVKARLVTEQDTIYSNTLIIRSIKNTFRVTLPKDELYASSQENIALCINKNEYFGIILEFTNPFQEDVIDVKLNKTIPLTHTISFKDYWTSGASLATTGIVHLNNTIPSGIYEVYVYIDGVEFKADSKIQVLQGEWSMLNSSFPGSQLYEYASFTIGNNLYITGGTSPIGTPRITKVWRYSFITNEWKQLNDFPLEFADLYHCNLVCRNKGYVILQNNNNNERVELWKYDELNDSWQMITTYPGSGVELTYFIIKDDLYIGGGIRAINNEVLEYTDFWSYDLIDKYWIRRKSIPFRNIFPTTLSCSSDQSGFVYLFDNTFWAYDPTNNSWSVKAEFPGPDRCYGNIVYLNNRVYLIGSAYYDILLQGLKDCWEYDISSGSWQLSSFVPSYSNRGFAGTYRNSLITGLGYAPLGRVDFYEPNLYIMTP